MGLLRNLPSARAWWIAGGFFVLWLAIMLAGSDIPPPRGFVWVVAGLVVICIGIALCIPRLWGVGRRHGLRAILVRTGSIGLVVGLVLGAAFALFSSGEPSAPPMNAVAYLIWFSVVIAVGAINGVVVGLVTSWLRPAS
ncbi:MAG: hypothetical protein VXX04_03875 [Actinomycetota bacterium]|nr:hypothetical protein [Actinomycetota bacterium]